MNAAAEVEDAHLVAEHLKLPAVVETDAPLDLPVGGVVQVLHAGLDLGHEQARGPQGDALAAGRRVVERDLTDLAADDIDGPAHGPAAGEPKGQAHEQLEVGRGLAVGVTHHEVLHRERAEADVAQLDREGVELEPAVLDLDARLGRVVGAERDRRLPQLPDRDGAGDGEHVVAGVVPGVEEAGVGHLDRDTEEVELAEQGHVDLRQLAVREHQAGRAGGAHVGGDRRDARPGRHLDREPAVHGELLGGGVVKERDLVGLDLEAEHGEVAADRDLEVSELAGAVDDDAGQGRGVRVAGPQGCGVAGESDDEGAADHVFLLGQVVLE